MFEEDNGTEFLKLGTCWLHKVHNAFRTGLKEVNFDFYTFAVAVHWFFKLSSAGREDYSKLVEITNLVAKYAINHCSTRWVTLKYVALRLLEQRKNLNYLNRDILRH